MEVLDVMTANRDKRDLGAARGADRRPDLKVDDSNTPPFIAVKTNEPGKGPNGEHIFLAGEEAIKKMTVGKGLKVKLFASEKEFPELVNPVQMAFDTQGPALGRGLADLPALEAEDADERQAPDPRGHRRRRQGRQAHRLRRRPAQPDRLRVLQRRRARRAGAEPGVPQGHQRRRQGRRRSESLLSGLDTADTHHTSTASRSIRAARSTSRKAPSTTRRSRRRGARPCAQADGGVFRFEPRTQKFEVYVPIGFANPHGHVFDRWGRDIVFDGTGGQPYYGPSFSTKKYYPAMEKHKRAAGLAAADAPGRRRGDPLQPALPRGDAGQPARAQRDRLPGHAQLQARARTAPA